MRYIDADKLYEDMQWSIQHDIYDKPFDYLAEIDCQPTADVRENVRGEWILLDDCSNAGYYCSECAKKVIREGWSDTVKKINFCPNCGAQMIGDNDDSI